MEQTDRIGIKCSLEGIVTQAVEIMILLFRNREHICVHLLWKMNMLHKCLTTYVPAKEAISPSPSTSIKSSSASDVSGEHPRLLALCFFHVQALGCFLLKSTALAGYTCVCKIQQGIWARVLILLEPWKGMMSSCVQNLFMTLLLLLLFSWKLSQKIWSYSLWWLQNLNIFKCSIFMAGISVLVKVYWHLEACLTLILWKIAYCIIYFSSITSENVQRAFKHTSSLIGITEEQEGTQNKEAEKLLEEEATCEEPDEEKETQCEEQEKEETQCEKQEEETDYEEQEKEEQTQWKRQVKKKETQCEEPEEDEEDDEKYEELKEEEKEAKYEEQV